MDKLKSIVFWGSCWGILEATLGWVLHLIHFKNEVLVLYPFGLMCMMMAVRQTGQASAVIKVAGVASLVKLINLFMLPAVPVYHVTNPAVAIFLEGLATWGFYSYVQRNPFFWKTGILIAAVMVFSSALLFRGWQVAMDTYVAYNPSLYKPLDSGLLWQWGWRSLVQGLMLVGVVYVVKFVPRNVEFVKWTNRLAMPLLSISILLNTLIK